MLFMAPLQMFSQLVLHGMSAQGYSASRAQTATDVLKRPPARMKLELTELSYFLQFLLA
jgi:hypothetical protein